MIDLTVGNLDFQKNEEYQKKVMAVTTEGVSDEQVEKIAQDIAAENKLVLDELVGEAANAIEGLSAWNGNAHALGSAVIDLIDVKRNLEEIHGVRPDAFNVALKMASDVVASRKKV